MTITLDATAHVAAPFTVPVRAIGYVTVTVAEEDAPARMDVAAVPDSTQVSPVPQPVALVTLDTIHFTLTVFVLVSANGEEDWKLIVVVVVLPICAE